MAPHNDRRAGGIRFTLAALTVFAISACSKKPADLYTFDLALLSQKSGGTVSLVAPSPLGKSAALRVKSAPGIVPLTLCTESDSLPWSRAGYLVADVVHENRFSVTLWVHFYQRGKADAPRISSKMGILPGLPTRIVLPLEYLDGETFFMARQERLLKGCMPGNRLPKDQIGQVTLEVAPGTPDFTADLWICNLRLFAQKPAKLPDTKPVVDPLGQWTARDWPGKTGSETELKSALARLLDSTRSAAFPGGWSRYGGWKAKAFKKTGFFRTQFDGRRWWLIDPDGFAFFSTGLDVVQPSAEGPVSGMRDLLEWLPGPKGLFAEAFGDRRGEPGFSFYTANLIRVYGAEWESKWRELSRNLLIAWRFNTIGNWSDRDLIRSARLPYVLPLRGFPTTRVLLYRDFPDVFSKAYRDSSAAFAEQMRPLKDDSCLIGYFLDNEPLWAFGRNNVASEMLATRRVSETRKALVAWLIEKYRGDFNAFTIAWNRPVDAFDSLLFTPVPDAAFRSPRAGADLWEFTRRMVREYLQVPSRALRKVDPNHMNLGIRYAGISSDLCFEASECFDVFSINMYLEKPDAKTIADITRKTGKPVMIGEFHHGSIDRGLPSTGIWGVASQNDRGIAYRYYVEQGAAMPSLVGIHLFQQNDQPVLGRFDGENYNIGLLDVCLKPYREFTDHVASTNAGVYEVASGRRKPSVDRAVSIPAIYF